MAQGSGHREQDSEFKSVYPYIKLSKGVYIGAFLRAKAVMGTY